MHPEATAGKRGRQRALGKQRHGPGAGAQCDRGGGPCEHHCGVGAWGFRGGGRRADPSDGPVGLQGVQRCLGGCGQASGRSACLEGREERCHWRPQAQHTHCQVLGGSVGMGGRRVWSLSATVSWCHAVPSPAAATQAKRVATCSYNCSPPPCTHTFEALIDIGKARDPPSHQTCAGLLRAHAARAGHHHHGRHATATHAARPVATSRGDTSC